MPEAIYPEDSRRRRAQKKSLQDRLAQATVDRARLAAELKEAKDQIAAFAFHWPIGTPWPKLESLAERNDENRPCGML